jgi:hypothetical protein
VKLVTYTGAHAAVEVPDAGIVAERGVSVKVEDDVAKRLLEQADWSEGKAADVAPIPKPKGN